MHLAPALIATLVLATGCYHPVPIVRADGLAAGGAQPPVEELLVRLPVGERTAITLVRQALFERGLMVARHDTHGHWLVAEAGAVDDPVLHAIRQYFVVAGYRHLGDSTTIVSLGALERRVQGFGTTRGTGAPQVLTALTRVSDRTQGDPGAWLQVRTVADWLVDHGGEPIDAAPRARVARVP
jgi:hypothetical protein